MSEIRTSKYLINSRAIDGAHFIDIKLPLPSIIKQSPLVSFEREAWGDREAYEIALFFPEVAQLVFSVNSALMTVGVIKETYGLGEADCRECPLHRKGSELLFEQELKSEFFAIFLIDVFTDIYRSNQSVPWQIKDAYIYNTRVAGCCEPLETQTPLF